MPYVYLAKLKTVDGTLYGFEFQRNDPDTCKIPSCSKRLSPSNKSGFCVSHNRQKIGRIACRVSC